MSLCFPTSVPSASIELDIQSEAQSRHITAGRLSRRRTLTQLRRERADEFPPHSEQSRLFSQQRMQRGIDISDAMERVAAEAARAAWSGELPPTVGAAKSWRARKMRKCTLANETGR